MSRHSPRGLGELWNRSKGHIHHGALRLLRETVTGIPEVRIEHDDVCKGCALEKFAKSSFPRSDTSSKGVFDLVHSDICGPMSTSLSKDMSTMLLLLMISLGRPGYTSGKPSMRFPVAFKS